MRANSARVRIYEGQLAVLSRDRRARKASPPSATWPMQERRALRRPSIAWSTNARVRPTALEPLWRVAGYALGAATALMGEKAAMACTVAVEEVIDEHYAAQLERLGDAEPN